MIEINETVGVGFVYSKNFNVVHACVKRFDYLNSKDDGVEFCHCQDVFIGIL